MVGAMTISGRADPADLLVDGEVVLYSTRWSTAFFITPAIFAIPFYILGFSAAFDPPNRGIGIFLLSIAVFISLSAYIAWTDRQVILSNQRVIFWAGLTKVLKSVPLNKIERVTRGAGVVTVRSGTAFNTLRLWGPKAEALSAAIERARVSPSPDPAASQTAPRVPAYAIFDSPADKRPKEMTRSDIAVSSLLLGFIAFALVLCNTPDTSSTGKSVMDQPVPSKPASVSTPESSPPTVSNATIVLVESDVPDLIATDFLSECWRKSVRGTPAWLAPGDTEADVLADLVGKGGINVRVEVVGNRIHTNTLSLASATLPGSQEPVDFSQLTRAGSINYDDALKIFDTTTRALTRCGIEGVPLPNGVYLFNFDPGRGTIPVTKLQEEPPKLSDTGITAPVPDTVNTERLMACWMRNIRNVPDWNGGTDRGGDTLSHFYGKGGVAVQVVVEGNQLNLGNCASWVPQAMADTNPSAMTMPRGAQGWIIGAHRISTPPPSKRSRAVDLRTILCQTGATCSSLIRRAKAFWQFLTTRYGSL